MLLATTGIDIPANAGMITINPIWVASILFSAVCIGFGWYIVRLDHHVEELRKEVMRHEQDIGGLKNADVSCTRDQDVLKVDMSHIRHTLLRLVGRKNVTRSLRNKE